ncbi:MAG: FxLYD domain-containing protein, partial [Candidatus Nitrosocosmicus sp.]
MGLSSFIMFTSPSSDNPVSAKVFINDGSDSSSSDSNIGDGGSSDGLLQQVKSNNALKQVPSNITDFPSPEDASVTQLTFLKTSQDNFGVYHIKGEIKNTGNDTLSFVKVKSHFYDNNMNILAIESGYTDPISIGPGKTGNFDIILFKDNYGLTP